MFKFVCSWPLTRQIVRELKCNKFLPHFLQVYTWPQYPLVLPLPSQILIKLLGNVSWLAGKYFYAITEKYFPTFGEIFACVCEEILVSAWGEIFVCLPASFSSTTELPLPSCLTRPPFTTTPPQFYVQLLIPPI